MLGVEISDGAPMRERERERERVANYLELPNKSMTSLQENSFFPALSLSLYHKRIAVVSYNIN